MSSNGSSCVWENFKVVNVDNAAVGYVQCDLCKTLLKWKSRDGTSGLSYHVTSCKQQQSATNRKITDLPGFFKNAVAIPAAVKFETTDVIVRMCATNIRYVLNASNFNAKKLILAL